MFLNICAPFKVAPYATASLATALLRPLIRLLVKSGKMLGNSEKPVPFPRINAYFSSRRKYKFWVQFRMTH